MKYFSILLVLGLSIARLPAQTPKLDSKALGAVDTAPTVTPPKFFPKNAGPVKEKKREYTFTGKGSTTAKAARVITMSDGSKVESPLVEIPLLFKKDAALLADAQSRANLQILAAKLKELQSTGARFCIEGHASIEGDPARNQQLSDDRALAIREALQNLGVEAAALPSAVGFGSSHAVTKQANAPDNLLAQDRRVLVVREK